MTRRLAVITLVVALFATAQGQAPRFGASTGTLSLTGTGTSFTLQQALIGLKQVNLESAVIYCSVACTVTQAQNGTPATATAGTAVAIQPRGPSATATVWTSSDVGAGTTVPGPLPIPAGGVAVLDLSKIMFARTSTSITNYTIIISSITGSASVTFYWSEQ